MNVLLLILSFFNFTSKRFISKEIEYQDCLYKYENYYVYDSGKYHLYYEDNLIRTYEKNTNIKIIKVNEKCLVFSIHNGILLIEQYNQNHQVLLAKQFDDIFYDEFNIYFFKEQLLFIGGIKEYRSEATLARKKDYLDNLDAIIFTIDSSLSYDEIYLYGGALNEHFRAAKEYAGDIYISLKKDMLSGGDFGNGGGIYCSYGLCRLNQDFDIENYVIVKNEEILDFLIGEEVIIATENNLYRLDHQLYLEESVKFPFQSIFVHLTTSKLAIVCGQTSAEIYDFRKRDFVCDFYYEAVNNIKIYDNAFVFDNGIKKRCFRFYDVIDIPDTYIYSGDIIKPKVFDMFQSIDTEISQINPYFNPLIYGDYQVHYCFDDNEIIRYIHIPFSVNVSAGIIYPLRYHLRFTGTALLNNKEIMNNHCITNPGKYRLDLIGSKQEVKTIYFEVASEQISFIESVIKCWDYVVNQYNPLLLQIPYQIDERFTIINAWINDEAYPCIYETGLLTVELPTDIAGIRDYFLQSITYSYNDKLYDYQINQTFTVNVLKDDLEIITEVMNENKRINFYVNIDDPDNSLRGISIINIKNGRENRISFPIANISLDMLPSGRDGKVYLRVSYDQGDGILKEIDICTITLDNHSSNLKIGELKLLAMEKDNYRLLISIPVKNYIKEIIMNNEIIHRYLADDYTANISIGLIIGLSSMYIIRKVRKYKLKKKRLIKN